MLGTDTRLWKSGGGGADLGPPRVSRVPDWGSQREQIWDHPGEKADK